MNWIPGPRTPQLLLAALVLFTPWVIWGSGASWGLLVLVLWLGISWAWLRLSRGWSQAPEVVRLAPATFPVGVWTTMALEVKNLSGSRQRFDLWEDLPADWEIQGMPVAVALEPEEVRKLTFEVRPTSRGDHAFGPAHLRMVSPGKGWQVLLRAGEQTPVKVFPNYAPVVRYALLALEGRQSATGIRKRRQRGTGAECHQLREYRDGDPITTVDWKATARRTQLIVRDYQEERDQRVAFLVDCGQRMRAFDGGVPLLDHSLHALLLLTYVALKQGDLVSVCSYGDRAVRLGRSGSSGNVRHPTWRVRLSSHSTGLRFGGGRARILAV